MWNRFFFIVWTQKMLPNFLSQIWQPFGEEKRAQLLTLIIHTTNSLNQTFADMFNIKKMNIVGAWKMLFQICPDFTCTIIIYYTCSNILR